MKELFIGSLDLSAWFIDCYLTGYGGFAYHIKPMSLPLSIAQDIQILCKDSIFVYSYWRYGNRAGHGLINLINSYPMPSYFVINGIGK